MVTFDAHVELLMEKAVGVVAMAGYNTFCEILSLDKRAILVPRTKPREEQLLRALRTTRMSWRPPCGGSPTSRCRRPAARRQC